MRGRKPLNRDGRDGFGWGFWHSPTSFPSVHIPLLPLQPGEPARFSDRAKRCVASTKTVGLRLPEATSFPAGAGTFRSSILPTSDLLLAYGFHMLSRSGIAETDPRLVLAKQSVRVVHCDARSERDERVAGNRPGRRRHPCEWRLNQTRERVLVIPRSGHRSLRASGRHARCGDRFPRSYARSPSAGSCSPGRSSDCVPACSW